MVDLVPASGSCARCRGALGLASVRRDGRWYCSAACAQDEPPTLRPRPVVPEDWLYPVPRRHLRRRPPLELRGPALRAGA